MEEEGVSDRSDCAPDLDRNKDDVPDELFPAGKVEEAECCINGGGCEADEEEDEVVEEAVNSVVRGCAAPVFKDIDEDADETMATAESVASCCC